MFVASLHTSPGNETMEVRLRECHLPSVLDGCTFWGVYVYMDKNGPVRASLYILPCGPLKSGVQWINKAFLLKEELRKAVVSTIFKHTGSIGAPTPHRLYITSHEYFTCLMFYPMVPLSFVYHTLGLCCIEANECIQRCSGWSDFGTLVIETPKKSIRAIVAW